MPLGVDAGGAGANGGLLGVFPGGGPPTAAPPEPAAAEPAGDAP